MPINKVSVHDFLALVPYHPVLDVRSPAEYAHAHIPGAFAFSLFTDEERKIIGTSYKQESREQAIKHGLSFFGPKMNTLVEQAEKISAATGQKKMLVHCWRGGMRSAAVAWLLDLYGFDMVLLNSGYKSFRHWVLKQFEKEYPFKVLGGYTGSGKTVILRQMEKNGATIIDLEALAQHKGSSFGGINMPPSPSQEMFENLLALQLFHQHAKAENGIWIEDESQRIGPVNIPMNLWLHMRQAPLYFLDIEFEQRLQHIVAGYGHAEKEQLVNAIIRIQKRLGGLETKTAISHLLENDFESSFRILLHYYDKQYSKGLHNRENLGSQLHSLQFQQVDPENIAQALCSIAATTQPVA